MYTRQKAMLAPALTIGGWDKKKQKGSRSHDRTVCELHSGIEQMQQRRVLASL